MRANPLPWVFWLPGLALLALASLAWADVPDLINFQAFVQDPTSGNPRNGTFTIQFTIWNDPTSSLPTDVVWTESQSLTINDGNLECMLGDINPLSDIDFDDVDRYLEIYFTSDAAPMTPRLRMVTVPYAFRAGTIDGAGGGSIDGSVLITGALNVSGTAHLGTLKIVPGATDGHVLTSDASGNASWQAPSGASDSVEDDFKVTSSGATRVHLQASQPSSMGNPGGGARAVLKRSDTTTIELDAKIDGSEVNGLNGPEITLYHPDDASFARVRLSADKGSSGGTLELDNASDIMTVELEASAEFDPGNSILKLLDSAGNKAFRLRSDSDSFGDAPEFSMYNADASVETVELAGSVSGTDGARLYLRDSGSNNALALDAEAGDGGATVWMRNRSGNTTIMIDADRDADPNEAKLFVFDSAGNEVITLSGVDGTITTQSCKITGGSDLSEAFDVVNPGGEVLPGMTVAIDGSNPEELAVTQEAYDVRVAGVVSGAGGVRPGMLMGQRGSVADGAYPVALSGRVYVRADASRAPIHRGDLLTTSEIPGHAMRVMDRDRAQGAILGKALSSLESGTGLVLLLVSLQ